jgi:hypothetical protein
VLLYSLFIECIDLGRFDRPALDQDLVGNGLALYGRQPRQKELYPLYLKASILPHK